MKKSLYRAGVCSIVLIVTFSCLDHPDHNPTQSCQIVQEVIRTGTTGPASVSTGETVLIDQATYGVPVTQTYDLAITQTHTYAYNTPGQLLQENITNTNPALGNLVYRYEYTPTTLKIAGEGAGRPLGETTYLLNSQGLITSPVNTNTTYVYNTEGYLTEITENLSGIGTRKTTNTIVDGNLVKKEIADPTSQLTTGYTYDVSKVNLPNKRIFEGKQSRNLPLKSVQNFITTNVTNPPLKTNFTTTYTYTFDEQGRVKRRVEVLTYSSGNGGDDPTLKEITVSTTDYTYSCR